MFELKKEQTAVLEDLERKVEEYKSNYTKLESRIKDYQDKEVNLTKKVDELEAQLRIIENELRNRILQSKEQDIRNSLQKQELISNLNKEREIFSERVITLYYTYLNDE